MRKKTMIIFSVLIVLFMLVGLIVPILSGHNAENNTETAPSEEEDASSKEDNSRIEGAEELLTESEEPKEDSTDDVESENFDTDNGTDMDSDQSFSGGSSGTGGNNSSQQSSGGRASQSKTSSETHANIPTISFPYKIPETQLVVQQISSYKGYFIEDGSDKAVTGIAAIVLTNNGGDLDFVGIGIAQGKRSLAFSASQIPAGATVIIQEQNRASYSSKDPYYSATATTTPGDKFEMSENLVSVKDNGDHTLAVTNISGEKLSEVKVYFKNYLPDEKVFVGGITYNITLTDLEPDTQTDVTANHYDSNYSVVVEVSAKK